MRIPFWPQLQINLERGGLDAALDGPADGPPEDIVRARHAAPCKGGVEPPHAILLNGCPQSAS
jgi:hypothetical protein